MSTEEQPSFVRACREFFASEPHGRKVEIAEFRALTRDDKVELRSLLIKEGIDVAPLPEPSAPGG
jgi:hypothetical protein